MVYNDRFTIWLMDYFGHRDDLQVSPTFDLFQAYMFGLADVFEFFQDLKDEYGVDVPKEQVIKHHNRESLLVRDVATYIENNTEETVFERSRR